MKKLKNHDVLSFHFETADVQRLFVIIIDRAPFTKTFQFTRKREKVRTENVSANADRLFFHPFLSFLPSNVM